MAGFGTVISFSLTIFIALGSMVGVIMMYSNQVVEQDQLLRDSFENVRVALQEQIDITFIEFRHNRVVIEIENIGLEPFRVIQNGAICFNVFVDSEFISSSNLDYSPQSRLSNNFRFIEPGSSGRIFINHNNFNSNSQIRLISCSGKTYELNLENANFENTNFRQRVAVSQNEGVGEDVSSQIVLDFEDVDVFSFDSNIEVLMTRSNLEHLILPFDELSQTGNDETGEFSYFLGTSPSPNLQAPTQKKGIILQGLDFDLSQRLTVEDFELNQRVTISFWFRPSTDLGSSSDEIIFSRSADSSYGIVFNRQGTSEIGFYTFNGAGDIIFDLSTNSLSIQRGDWVHVAVVLDNDDTHRIYINAQQRGTSSQTLTLPSTPVNLEIGNLN